MAKTVSFIRFTKTFGKPKLRHYNMNGNSWIALLCQDSEGNETFIAPPKDTNTVVNGDGEVLVDFNSTAEEICAAIKAHKSELVVLLGNKNWDSPEEEEIPTYTLACKLNVDEIDIDLD